MLIGDRLQSVCQVLRVVGVNSVRYVTKNPCLQTNPIIYQGEINTRHDTIMQGEADMSCQSK